MNKISIIILLLLTTSIFSYAQKSLTSEIVKKIETATPKSLPQSPITSKLKSDAEDENLRGKVKKVLEENEDLSGTWSYQGKKFRSIKDYNEKGNFTKAVFFASNGNPYEVQVYGYIDGMRVNDCETIYEGSGIISAANPQNEEDTKKPKVDFRYCYKYEYKYVNGKLAEKQMFYNNGTKGMLYVYSYSGNQMEELAYNDKGRLNRKYITVFDSKGYEIERYDGGEKQIIKNESFDKQGNWTKRTFLRLEIENEKEVYKPRYVEYRTFTYYP